MTKASPDLCAIFTAVRDAHTAYVRLSAKGHGRSDQELARDPDYAQFYKSGLVLATIGGSEAISETIRLLLQVDGARAGMERPELERLWAGMGSWKTTPRLDTRPTGNDGRHH